MKISVIWPNGEIENRKVTSFRGLTRRTPTGCFERPKFIIYDDVLPPNLAAHKRLMQELKRADVLIPARSFLEPTAKELPDKH